MLKRSPFKNRGSGFKNCTSPMKRSAFKKKSVKRKPGYSEPEYMEKVAGLGCAICARLGFGWRPAQVHHRRTGTGGGRRAKDTDTCPLCENHHTGADGIHQGRKNWELRFGITELELIRETQTRLGYIDDNAIE